MAVDQEVQHFIACGYEEYLPHVSIDCVIFGYHESQLKILLLKWKNTDVWCLPGGHVLRTEALHAAAGRIVAERTGLRNLFLQQFHTFGDPDRARLNAEHVQSLSDMTGVLVNEGNWLMDYFVSVGFYALTEFSAVTPMPDLFTESCVWWDVQSLPNLMLDHNVIVQEALKAMRMQLYHQPIGYNLLPDKFTLPEIQVLYETILGKQLDRRNFPKKLLTLGVIRKLNEQRKIGAHRSPYLYELDMEVYRKALAEGMVIAI